MPVHLTDSLIYQNSWGTRSWLEILAVLAETQAEFDVIPRGAAQLVAATCRTIELDEAFFEEVRLDFEATNHSTLGLIRAVQRRCPGASGEWLYYGATVQDITDTWMALVLQRVRGIVGRELKEIEGNLSRRASEHRDTVMAGRTHGQIGLPITFGFKAAVWAMEVRRHRVRLAESAPRLDVGQLAGGVGSITMPHKRNPEISEHLGTLARVIRHNASLIAESLVHDHERDGRSWKTEWVVLAETCLAAGKLLELLRVLTGNLVIHTDRMQANLDATGGFVFSEAVMLALAARIGKQSAHTLVYETAMNARATGRGLKDAILDMPEFSRYLTIDEIEALFEYRQHTGHCGAMVDQVVAALRDAETPENLM
jgi:adenylosuccinate lyase